MLLNAGAEVDAVGMVSEIDSASLFHCFMWEVPGLINGIDVSDERELSQRCRPDFDKRAQY